MKKMSITLEGYAVIEKVAKPSGNTSNVYVPKDWEGHRVKIILLDPLED